MIKNLVIIDDTDYKRENIKGYMSKLLKSIRVYEFSFINEALRFLCIKNFEEIKNKPNEWLIVTDMVMPRYSDSRLIKDGGMEVLAELERRGFECPVIVASSGDLDTEACKKEYKNVIGVVKESSSVYNLEKYRSILRKYLE